MRKIISLLLALSLALALCGCGVLQESITVEYDKTYTVENEKLAKYDSLQWSSSDESIATVRDGSIKGIAPGSAMITAAQEDGKTVAEYSVEVITIPVTSIVISTNSCTITEGETYHLSYTLFPENASYYGLKWNSADNMIASVSEDGTITAFNPGQTTISISNTQGFIATCSVTVKKALPNFKVLYGQWEGENWFEVGDDGTWMTFDTNPNDDDGDNWWRFYSAFIAVEENLPQVLRDLGFKDSVYEKMESTTALQGRQEVSNETAIVSWTYHPDHGLQVLIEVND